MTAATGPEEIIVQWLRANVTLAAEAIDISETLIDVDDGTLFKGGDVILVDTEQMLVGSVSGNTLTVTRAHNSSTAATHADNSGIWLWKNRRFKLQTPIQPQAVDGFPGKVTIGAYNIDSNDILSAWVISDLTGGHGIAEHDEGVTDNRYRFGTIYTRYASQWTKPFVITESTLGSGAIDPLGDLLYSGTTYNMRVSGTDLYQNTTNRGAIATSNYENGVQYRGTAAQSFFYIPRASGYSTFNPVTNAIVDNATPDIVSFLPWDEKLLAIDIDGVIYYATAAAATTTFTPYTIGGSNVRLDDSFAVYKLHAFVNRQGESTPYVVTNGEVWAFDADTPRFYRIPDFNSRHPRFGWASDVWHGELFVASGMDILAFNGEVIRNVGFTRDDGLPYAYQGYVHGFAAGQNALYAAVVGKTIGADVYGSFHEWSGFGWHCIHANANAVSTSRIAVSSAGANYILNWGLRGSGTVYTQTLPVSFTNPREAIDNSASSFGISWITPALNTFYLETGRFDANMKGYRKIANAVEMDVRTMPVNNSIKFYYRIDDETSWTQMYHTDGSAPSGQTVTTTGHHQFEFGPYDPNGHYIGIDFESIEFRLEFVDTVANTTTPAVTSLVFSFLKIMNPSLAWTANIDLDDSFYDASPQVLIDELSELRSLPRFFNIQHRDRTYRARMTGMQTSEDGGNEETGSARLSFIEIPGVLGVAADE